MKLEKTCLNYEDARSEIYRLGVQIDFFDFGVGTHHGRRLLKEIRSAESADCLLV
ncbi:hypothetical protein [Stutzerimonas kunmingensis]|uniref:hypothetical protein n=1 Tax=Stutzerimonas kunmingensis TaxID=1211807 RepID=UPI0028B158C2|nr:hypothetical protein [Stutzerimonas kunmingensis]